MALTTHQLQGSCGTFPSVPSSWTRGNKVKQFLPTCHPVGRKDRLFSLRCRPCSSVGASLVHGPKSNLFKISAFKGNNSRHDDSSGRANGSMSINNPVKVSYLQHESQESSIESSSKARNIVLPPYALADDATTIQNLFKQWLVLLRTPSQTQQVNEAREELSPVELSETSNTLQKQESAGFFKAIFKAVWCYFLGIDATIKIPLLIFTPLYLAINIKYGSEVSKELIPLWILGPLIMSLHVKMFRAISGLYVFTFKQTVKIIKHVPAYSFLVYEYLFRGKLKEAIRIHLWQPLEDIKHIDYDTLRRTKMKEFGEWSLEKYLDFTELIWPFYNKFIRILKKSNLL